jgi:hypothetical protein
MREPDEVEHFHRVRAEPAFLGERTRHPDQRTPRSVGDARVLRDQEVLEDGQTTDQADVLEGPADPEGGPAVCRE